MSAIYVAPNQTFDKIVGLHGQSFATLFVIYAGASVSANALVAGGYCAAPRIQMTGLDGISTLKRYKRSGVNYGYMWDEDTDTAGPMLSPSVSGITVPATVPTPDVVFAATSEADRDTITDAAFWQGQGDESGGLLEAERTLWTDSHISAIEFYRETIVNRAGDATPRTGSDVRIHLDQIGRRIQSSTTVSCQIIREQKIAVAAAMTNVQICGEFYDLELVCEVDPDQPTNEHMTDKGFADAGKRLAESVIAGGGARLLGPVVASVTLATSTRVDVVITVESGETLVKPARPTCLRFEINGVATVPASYAWSGNTLQCTFTSPITGGTGRFFPIYGSCSDFDRDAYIHYADATSSAHPYYGYSNMPLRSGLPITF